MGGEAAVGARVPHPGRSSFTSLVPPTFAGQLLLIPQPQHGHCLEGDASRGEQIRVRACAASSHPFPHHPVSERITQALSSGLPVSPARLEVP